MSEQQLKKQLGPNSGNTLHQSTRSIIKDSLPQKVISLDHMMVEKVFCGSEQTFCIAFQEHENQRQVYSWGCNQYAKLGHSYEHRSDLS